MMALDCASPKHGTAQHEKARPNTKTQHVYEVIGMLGLHSFKKIITNHVKMIIIKHRDVNAIVAWA